MTGAAGVDGQTGASEGLAGGGAAREIGICPHLPDQSRCARGRIYSNPSTPGGRPR